MSALAPALPDNGGVLPQAPLGAETRLALWDTQASSLPIPIPEHHPLGVLPAWTPSACTTIIPRALSAPPRQWVPQPFSAITNIWWGEKKEPAPSQRWSEHPPPSDRGEPGRVERVVAGSCQHPAVRAQIPWQPMRSSSQLPAGALDRGPGTSMKECRSSAKKLDMGGMKPGSYCPGKRLPSGTSMAAMGSPMCWGRGVTRAGSCGSPPKRSWG